MFDEYGLSPAARQTEGRRPPELVPDCCACGTAKYEMTFEGLWSQETHPKDYPTRQYHYNYPIDITDFVSVYMQLHLE